MFLKFRYVNWRGNDHEYVIEPEPVLTLDRHNDEEGPFWQIHGDVVTRDGDTRTEMMPTRRRSFKLVGMYDIEQFPSRTEATA